MEESNKLQEAKNMLKEIIGEDVKHIEPTSPSSTKGGKGGIVSNIAEQLPPLNNINFALTHNLYHLNYIDVCPIATQEKMKQTEQEQGFEKFVNEKKIQDTIKNVFSLPLTERTPKQIEWAQTILSQLKIFRPFNKHYKTEVAKILTLKKLKRHRIVLDSAEWTKRPTRRKKVEISRKNSGNQNLQVPGMNKSSSRNPNGSMEENDTARSFSDSVSSNESSRRSSISSDSVTSSTLSSSMMANNNGEGSGQQSRMSTSASGNRKNGGDDQQNPPKKSHSQFFIILSGAVTVMSASWPKPSSGGGNDSNSEKTPGSGPPPNQFPSFSNNNNSKVQHNSKAISGNSYKEESGIGTPDSEKEGGTDDTFPGLEEATVLCHLEKGDCIGEINVMKALERDKRRYFWLTRENTELLVMDLEQYQNTLKAIHESELEKRVSFLRQQLVVPLFTNYRMSKMYHLAKRMGELEIPPKRVVMKQGTPLEHAKAMFFILSGEFKMMKQIEFKPSGGKAKTTHFLDIAVLRRGEYFGEMSLVQNKERDISVFSITDGVLLCLSKIDFFRFFGRIELEVLETYAKTYPSEGEVYNNFLKQKRWEEFKFGLKQFVSSKDAID